MEEKEYNTIYHLLRSNALHAPEAIAITAPGRRGLTYLRLLTQVDAVKKSLNAMGIGCNDRVVIVLSNSPEMAVLFLAVSSGATCAPLNPAYRESEFDFYLSDLDAKAIIVQSGMDSPAVSVATKHGIPIIKLAPVLEGEAGVFTLKGPEGCRPVDQDFAGPDDVALVLHTSGTTSKPKKTPLTHRNLCASAHNIKAVLQLVGKDRCFNVMPLFHIHGLIGAVLSSMAAGASVAVDPDFEPAAFPDWIEELTPTWYTAVPTMHQAILRSARDRLHTIRHGSLRFIRSSSASLPPKVMAELEEIFKVPVIEAYGMTEASHQIASNPLPPRDRKVGSVGVSAGSEFAVIDEARKFVATGQTGEIVVRGANITRGYEGHSQTNEEAFIDGWFRTGDQGYIDADGYLFLTGRIKEIINRGGEKISPYEVEAVLMDHPAIADAVVFAVPHNTLGEDTAAAVVLKEKCAVTEIELQRFASVKLADFKIPSRIAMVAEIPKGATGKVQRVRMAKQLGLGKASAVMSETRMDSVACRTEVEAELVRIWAEVLRTEPMAIDDNFFELGGDSLTAAQVVSRVREAFQVELTLRSLFEHPTIADLAERVETARGSEKGEQTVAIFPVSRDKDLVLSFSQERLWFLAQLEPGHPVYNRPVAFRLRGHLNVDVLGRCLNEIVRRHEVLRTNYLANDDQPVQVISPSFYLDLTITDLSDLPHAEREAEAQRRCNNASQRPFDLAQGPLVEANIFRLSEQDHLFLYITHHIAFDGWSTGVLLRELSVLYEAFSNNQPSPLPELSVQYADFAVWQRNRLQGEILERQLSYWKAKLEGAPALQLPTDRTRPPVQRYRGEKRSFVLDKEMGDALKALSHQENATLFMTLLAVFQLLLHRYTAQEDIVIGSPIAGRPRPEIEGLIGFFVNTLVLRNDFSGNPTFKELLDRVRQVCLDAYTHQDVPFEKLVEVLRPERSLGQSPLFQIMFVLENTPTEALRFGDVAITPYEMDTEPVKFDLTLSMHEESEGLRAALNYSTDLFDGATIDRMIRHFQTVLEGIVADPDQRISELPMLTEAEKRQLLVEWNDTKTEYPRDKCVHQLFEEQVERTRDATAVVFEDQRLTYRELNKRANQLAHYLRKQGVGPEVLVGICVERSLEMIIGLLGILKAGGAYVPLDPDYPKERLAFMLDDTQAPVLLTQQRLVESLPECNARVVCVDRDWKEIAKETEESPDNKVTAENLAYVIYTSGSSGKPKGVEVPHRGILRLLLGVDYVQLDANQTFLHLAPISFDAATFELWGALLHGAKCVLFPGKIPNPKELGDKLHLHGISTLWLTASLFNTVLDEEPEALSGVRQLLIGGEALSVPHVRRAVSLLPETKIINGYGPTESTTFACCFSISSRPDESINSIAIGRPISNTQVYLLDAHLKLVPIGIAGELYIGGDGLARGYLNRPELTEEKFIPHPFSSQPGSRLYRTGDLARYLADGNIKFLGRIDQQIKIRGYRVELGEIESVLGQHPAVRETVVVVREEVPGDKRLVAYINAVPGPCPTVDDLNTFLKTKLPSYMVPSTFVFLGSLPLTPNGKMDRTALPVPDQARPELAEFYVAPCTQVEERIAAIWSQILGLEKIGIRDNFFDLGGHSLLAIQVISRAREAFQSDVALRSLFENPTVARLAECVEESRQRKILQTLPILPLPRERHLPLSFAQQRLWFLDQLEPNSSVYNIPSAHRLKGPVDIRALEQSLNEIVRRHEALRTTFSTVGGQPVQRISPSLSLPLPSVDLRYLPESERDAEVRRLSNEEAQRPFDLCLGPLVRATLLRLNDEGYVLLLTMHHIASDGWSMGVLFGELSVLYEAFSRGKPSPLEELPVQYVDFAQWQRNWLQGEVLETQLGYWKAQLDNNPILQLPTDRPRPAVQSYRGAGQSITLSSELTEALKNLSRQQGVTVFMTLLATFQTLLHRYTGQDDIVVGSPVAGRNRTEIEGLIGFFVNNVVLRTDLSCNLTFKEILSQVRETSLEAYAHQDLPFEKLVEALQPERSLSHTPLFQVMFAVENVSAPRLELSGVAVNPVTTKVETAKFDLQLSIADEQQGFKAKVQYNTDLFDALTVTRLLDHFQTLLEGIVVDPDQRISELPMLTEIEKRQLLIEWNETKTSYPRDKCIHQLFEEQVERTPDATAVVFEDQQLTYRELNKRANQLAHYLRKQGVGPEILVGICIERSLVMILGLLAILKAGGAYVPLDPEYPKERLSFMLEDAKVRVLLTQQGVLEELAQHEARVICLDRDWGKISKESDENPNSEITEENLAYFIYTSGSTGNPKGVEVQHRGVVNFLNSMRRKPGLTDKDTLLAVTTLSFDIFGLELYLPITVGARVVLVNRDLAADGMELARKTIEPGITVMQATPATWQMLLESGWQGSNDLKILCGGEALTRELADQLLERSSSLWNMYGPAETTIWSTTLQVSPGVGPIPLGRPIDNTQVYLLDAYLNPVPVGVSGELYIGGDGLARGYLNRPELTQEKFIRNPFSSDLKSRLYRTGDLARYLPDANIEFLGRIDNQIKIRGYRIELGEIEAVLSQHAAVREAVVMARDEGSGDRWLVAYINAVPGQCSTVDDLTEFLKTKLPNYMVPSRFMFLDSLPLTPNGKVDRQALPATDGARTASDESLIAPRNDLERQLAKIWESILGVQTIGVTDSFFDLGGHSLLAVRVTSQVEKIFGKKLPLTSFFQAPTVEQLAKLLSDEVPLTPWSSLVPIRPEGPKPPFFWVHGEASDAFLSRYLDPDQPLYGILHQNHDGQRARHTTVQDIAAHYLSEIRTAQAHGPYFLGGYCFGAMVAFEMAQQLKNQNEKVAFLVLLSPASPRHNQFMNHLARNTSGASTNGRLSHDNVSRHLQNLKVLGPQERFTYVLKRLRGAALLWVLGPLREIAEKAACKVYWRLGYPLPRSLRSPYLMDLYDKANRAYVPEVYPGHLVIYKDEGSSDPRTWKTLVAGELEIHEVPGDHLSVLAERNVEIWGKQLSADLHRAQSELTGSEVRNQKSEVNGQLMADEEAQSAHTVDASERGDITDFELGEVS